jgi:hypothetical protein
MWFTNYVVNYVATYVAEVLYITVYHSIIAIIKNYFIKTSLKLFISFPLTH